MPLLIMFEDEDDAALYMGRACAKWGIEKPEEFMAMLREEFRALVAEVPQIAAEAAHALCTQALRDRDHLTPAAPVPGSRLAG